jgi:general secretion pathway protein A
MIQEYYGLTTDAFSLRPDLDFLFVSNAHEETLAHLAFGLEQNEDITLIVGDIGTGKTLALHRLLAQISKAFVPVYISVTQMDFEQLLLLIMMKLGAPVESGVGLAGLLHSFEQQLVSYRERNQKILLVIDEAQNLPHDSLESVRMLMNLAQPGTPVLQLILVGQLDLRRILERPDMRQFRQRIRVDYELSLLSREETEAYLLHRLDVAGRAKPLFKKSAIDKIYTYSRGVPRLVNHVATRALLNGFVAEANLISGKHVEELGDVDAHSEPEPRRPAGVVATEPLQEVAPLPPRPQVVRAEKPGAGRSSGKRWGLTVFALVALLCVAGYFTQDSWRPLLTARWATGADDPAPVTAGVTAETTPAAGAESEGDAAKDADVAQTVEAGNDGGGDGAAGAAIPRSSADDVPPLQEASRARTGATAAPTVAAVTTRARGFLGHVASFRDENRAADFRSFAEGQALPAVVRKVQIKNGEMWYRVYFGPYASRELAEEGCADLKNRGLIQYYLVTEDKGVGPG